MEKSSKRGKIPQHDWPSIISRYESGETLASIARTYDCSPPAISYIVSRTRARGMTGEASGPKADLLTSTEPQLVKAVGFPAATPDISDRELMHSNNPFEKSKSSPVEAVQLRVTEQSSNIPEPGGRGWSADRPPVPPPEAAQAVGDGPPENRPAESGIGAGNGSLQAPGSNGGPSPSGEARRTLHLSLPQGNGIAGGHTPHSAPAPQNASNIELAADMRSVSRLGAQTGFASQPRQPSVQGPHFGSANQPGAVHGSAAMPETLPKARAGGVFIDQALRERINDDIAAFLAAFDAALDHDTAESRTELREATDRLLRAGARTRIELERLEARIPLAAREGGQRPLPVPRAR